MAQAEQKPDFNSIRAAVEKLHQSFGGRVNIEQWFTEDGEVLKVIATWKKENLCKSFARM